jgi:hypothetical protein
VFGSDPGEPAVTRFVVRSSGFNSSLPREQVIGLGQRSGPYRVEILWPSGGMQTVKSVASGERIEVVEAAD